MRPTDPQEQSTIPAYTPHPEPARTRAVAMSIHMPWPQDRPWATGMSQGRPEGMLHALFGSDFSCSWTCRPPVIERTCRLPSGLATIFTGDTSPPFLVLWPFKKAGSCSLMSISNSSSPSSSTCSKPCDANKVRMSAVLKGQSA